jgi:hypothetical protein
LANQPSALCWCWQPLLPPPPRGSTSLGYFGGFRLAYFLDGRVVQVFQVYKFLLEEEYRVNGVEIVPEADVPVHGLIVAHIVHAPPRAPVPGICVLSTAVTWYSPEIPPLIPPFRSRSSEIKGFRPMR